MPDPIIEIKKMRKNSFSSMIILCDQILCNECRMLERSSRYDCRILNYGLCTCSINTIDDDNDDDKCNCCKLCKSMKVHSGYSPITTAAELMHSPHRSDERERCDRCRCAVFFT